MTAFIVVRATDDPAELVIAQAVPLGPPSVPRSVMTPFSQKKARKRRKSGRIR